MERDEGEAPSAETDASAKSKKDAANSLKEIVDGTTRIGKSVGEAFKGVAEIFTGRDFVVMVRVNKDSLDRIDQLVESGLFRSRSESAAFLIARGAEANGSLFDQIENKVSEINRLREELRTMVNFSSDKHF